MNGFVTSKYGQVIMYHALSKYINEHVQTKKEFQDFASPNLTCVAPGKLHSRFNFYKWFYHWLVLGIQTNRNSRNIMRNITVTKRSNLSNQHTLPAQGLFEILNRMEINDYAVLDVQTGAILKNDHPFPSFVVAAASTINPNARNNLPPEITFNEFRYRLDHASLGIYFENGGAHSSHAITGIRCIANGHPVIIDSNSDNIYSCDWSNPMNITQCETYVRECQRLYHSVPTNPIVLFAVYTNVNISPSLLKNNISPNKLLNRYNRAMNTS